MPHRLLAIPDAAFYATSAISAVFAWAGWLVAQADPGPMVSGGAVVAGIVTIITAISPLILGAMDRKKLRATLATTVTERDAYSNRVDRLEQYLVQQATEGKAKLPAWFFEDRPKAGGTGEYELIQPPEGDDQ